MSLYGPTQLVNLLNKTADGSKSVASEAMSTSKQPRKSGVSTTKSADHATMNASGDLFGDDDDDDMFRDMADDSFKKPKELDGSKMAVPKQPQKSVSMASEVLSTSRQTPSPAKCSPEVLLTRCDAEVTPVSEAAATSKQPQRSNMSPAAHDESSLCVRRGKRKLVSSDESSAGLNESCDSPLLVVQGPFSVIS